jgi:hypothetical protein
MGLMGSLVGVPTKLLLCFPSRSKPTFLKKESEAYEITSLSVCLSVSPLITFEPVGRFLWNSVGRSCHSRWPLHLLSNPVSSTIPKWRTFKLLRWIQNLHQSTWDHEILYTDRYSKVEQLLMRAFLSKTKNTNMAAVWMLKFIVCFVETTHELLHFDKWTLVL